MNDRPIKWRLQNADVICCYKIHICIRIVVLIRYIFALAWSLIYIYTLDSLLLDADLHAHTRRYKQGRRTMNVPAVVWRLAVWKPVSPG